MESNLEVKLEIWGPQWRVALHPQSVMGSSRNLQWTAAAVMGSSPPSEIWLEYPQFDVQLESSSPSAIRCEYPKCPIEEWEAARNPQYDVSYRESQNQAVISHA